MIPKSTYAISDLVHLTLASFPRYALKALVCMIQTRDCEASCLKRTVLASLWPYVEVLGSPSGLARRDGPDQYPGIWNTVSFPIH